MQLHAGLARKPMFMPSVGHFHQGMLVNIPVTEQAMDRIDSLEQVHLALQDRYKDEPCVTVHNLTLMIH